MRPFRATRLHWSVPIPDLASGLARSAGSWRVIVSVASLLALAPGTTLADVRPASPPVGVAPAKGLLEAPAYRGIGLFVAAGLAAGSGLIQQVVAYQLVQRTCGVAQANIMTLETFDGHRIPIREGVELAAGAAVFGLACVGAAGPALTLRMQAPLLLGGAVGFASAGGHARGRSDAFSDALVHRRDRSRRARVMRVLGSTLVGAGAALWASSRLVLLDNKAGCSALGCIVAFDLLTLQSSGALTIAGAALLSSGLAYRRFFGRYIRARNLGATPLAGRGLFGLAVSGAF